MMSNLAESIGPVLGSEEVRACALVDLRPDRRYVIPGVFILGGALAGLVVADLVGALVAGTVAGWIGAWLGERAGEPDGPLAGTGVGRAVLAVTPDALVLVGIQTPSMHLTGLSHDVRRADLAAVALTRNGIGLDELQATFRTGEAVRWMFVRKPSAEFRAAIEGFTGAD